MNQFSARFDDSAFFTDALNLIASCEFLVRQGWLRETIDAREATDERLHGVGAGGQEETSRPVPPTAQRRTQQNSRKTLEVSSFNGFYSVFVLIN